MYTLISAYARAKGVNNRWSPINISNKAMFSIFREYEKVYVSLSNPYYTNPVVLDLDSIKQEYKTNTLSFNNWLSQLGDTALPVIEGVVRLKTNYVKYQDAVKAGYKIHSIGDNLNISDTTPHEYRDHIALVRQNTDYSELGKYCLAIVNGLVCRIDYNSQRAVIYNANKYSVNCNRYKVGLLSFKNIAEIECVPITNTMISKRHANTPLKNKLYITVPDGYENYHPMLVLGGYLYPADKRYFYNVDKNTYCLETARANLLSRYMESKYMSGYTVPDIPSSPVNDNAIAISDLFDDTKIIELATSLESFIVFVKTDSLYYEHELIARTTIPGSYIVHESAFQQKPIVGGYGLFANYWYVKEEKRYAIYTDRTDITNYNFLTTDSVQLLSADNSGYSANPVRNTDLSFITIATDVAIID